jgi:hypothetical protein
VIKQIIINNNKSIENCEKSLWRRIIKSSVETSF